MKTIHTISILTILAFLSHPLYSQDLLVTSDGDSINCKITKIKTDYIYFTFKYKEEIRSTLLPLNEVKFHQSDYFETAIVPIDKIVNYENYPHFKAAVNFGWSTRTSSLPDDINSDMRDYYSDLQSGFNYGIDLSYFFSEHIGVCFNYTAFRTKNDMNEVIVNFNDGTSKTGKLSDDITINYFGPSYSLRFLNNVKTNCLILNFGLGYLGYKNEGILITDYTIKSSTMGVRWDIGYEFGIRKEMALGFKLSLLSGALAQYEYSDINGTKTIKLEQDNYEGLARVDLSVGLRFNK